jgi:hypothetical protein
VRALDPLPISLAERDVKLRAFLNGRRRRGISRRRRRKGCVHFRVRARAFLAQEPDGGKVLRMVKRPCTTVWIGASGPEAAEYMNHDRLEALAGDSAFKSGGEGLDARLTLEW